MTTITRSDGKIFIVHDGVQYISDTSGYFRYNAENNNGTPPPHKTCNYLKYFPTRDNITTSEDIKLLQIEYYVNRYNYNSTDADLSTVELSLSEVPDEKIIGTISVSLFKQGISMAPATVKYHPNGGVAAGGSYLINSADNCSNIIDNYLTENFQSIDTLFKKTGYSGTAWNYYHPYDKDAASIVINNQASFLGRENYLPIYPDTTIYLYATWALTPYTITFYRNHTSSDSTISGTATAYYQSYQYGLLANAPTAPSGKTFLGWHTSRSTTTPQYYAKGDFLLTSANNISLYAIWGNHTGTSTNPFTVLYQPGSNTYGYGIGGARLKSYDKGSTFSLPGVKDSVPWNFNDLYGSDKLPRRPGYSFQYWVDKEGTRRQPGETGLWYSNDNNLVHYADWDGYADQILADANTKEIEIFNGKYTGWQQTFIFWPATYDRIVKLRHNPKKVPNLSTRVIAYHVIDEFGNSLPGSYSRYNYGSNETITTNSILLKANKTYYLEASSEKWDYSGYNYYISITLTPSTNTETISPNTGSYYLNGLTSSANTSITFSSEKNLVGASSQNYTSGLSSFNGTSGSYPSLPFKTGYWFEQWIGTADAVPEYPYTASGNAFATKYPQRDFGVSALWQPNQFYISYNGNENDIETMMANSSHKFDQTVTLLPNQYTRSTHITYVSRKGYYSDEDDWIEKDNDYMTLIESTHRSVRQVKLHHTYLGWAYGDINLEDKQSISFTDWQNAMNKTFENYGDSVELLARWQFNSVKLPKMHRDGFIFMGWYTESDGGDRVGYKIDENSDDEYYCYEGKEITLYAHWDPIGLVMINVHNKDKNKEEWRYAIPYIYTKENGWQRALSNIYTDKQWKVGVNLGQNLTDYQSDHL